MRDPLTRALTAVALLTAMVAVGYGVALTGSMSHDAAGPAGFAQRVDAATTSRPEQDATANGAHGKNDAESFALVSQASQEVRPSCDCARRANVGVSGSNESPATADAGHDNHTSPSGGQSHGAPTPDGCVCDGGAVSRAPSADPTTERVNVLIVIRSVASDGGGVLRSSDGLPPAVSAEGNAAGEGVAANLSLLGGVIA